MHLRFEGSDLLPLASVLLITMCDLIVKADYSRLIFCWQLSRGCINLCLCPDARLLDLFLRSRLVTCIEYNNYDINSNEEQFVTLPGVDERGMPVGINLELLIVQAVDRPSL